MSETMNLTKEQTERVLCKFLEQENGFVDSSSKCTFLRN